MEREQDESGWKLEAWKAAINMFEKTFLLILGALFIPTLIGAVRYTPLFIVLGLVGVIIFGVGWLILVLRAYLKED